MTSPQSSPTPNYSAIPAELRLLPQWVCYRMEPSESDPNILAKIPRKPNGGARARINDPSGWTTFEEALAASRRYDGIEFMLSEADPYTFIDLDHCVDPSTRGIEPWAQTIINDFNSYTEFSRSATGIHILVRGGKPGSRCRNARDYPNIEIYDHSRPIVMTGDIVPNTLPAIQPAQNEINTLYAELFAGVDEPAGQGQAQGKFSSDSTSSTEGVASLSDSELLQRMLSSERNGHSIGLLWAGNTSEYNGDDSAADQALINHLAWWTDRDPDRMDRMFRQSGLFREKWNRRDYRERTISAAISTCPEGYRPKHPRAKTQRNGQGKKKQSGAATSIPDSGLPRIICSNRQQRDVTQEAIAALDAANTPPVIYKRAGTIVRLRTADTSAGNLAIIDPMSVSIMRCQMSRTADYVRVTQSGAEISVYPPQDNAIDVLAWGEWPFPELDAVTASPIVKPDGTIHDQPGYDPDTKLVYLPEPGFTVPKIPAKPTAAQVTEAIDVVEDVLADFPWVSPADRANAFAMMLTPLMRSAIKGSVPLAVVNAPQPGSGKGMLTRTVNIITTGREASMMTAPDKKEEWRKSITTHLMNGSTFITIDNVESKLYDENLATVLTAHTWSDRLLGTNNSVHIPNRAVFIATGNNVKLGGDLPRRAYWVNINPHTSRPELRTGFRHSNLIDYVSRNRGKLVGALLTMIRAWYAADRPLPKTTILGSFEEWSGAIGGILETCGIEGFLGNAEAARARACEDEDGWENFLRALEYEFGTNEFTAQEIEALVNDKTSNMADALPDWLESDPKRPSSFVRKLGKALARYEDKCYGPEDIRVIKTINRNYNKTHWAIETNKSVLVSIQTNTETNTETNTSICAQNNPFSPPDVSLLVSSLHPVRGKSDLHACAHDAHARACGDDLKQTNTNYQTNTSADDDKEVF